MKNPCIFAGIFFVFKHSTFQNLSVYDNGGKGNAIVYLHGLGDNASHADFLKDICTDQRILIPEFSGHGLSKKSAKPIDIYEIALGLEALFDHYDISNPMLIGHSLGGQVAMLYEIVKPGRASSLLLIAPAGLELFNDMQKRIIMSTWQMTSYFHQVLSPIRGNDWFAGESKGPDADVVQAYLQSMMDRPVKELLPRIHCPVHIFFGENDPLIPNRMYSMESPVGFARNVVQGLNNFQVHSIPKAGHWPMLENREGLAHAIQKFIS